MMTLRKIWRIALISLSLVGFCLATVVCGAEKPSPVKVMTLSGNAGLAMVKLFEENTAAKSRFEYTILKSPNLMMAKLVAGEADIGVLPVNQAAILYNKGVGVQVAAIIGWGVLYIVGNDPALQSWKDLKGKEIYLVAKGAVPDLLFRYLTVRNGLDPDRDLKLNYVASPVELAQLTAAGKVSLATLPEPWVTEVLFRAPRLKVVLDFQSEWSRLEKQQRTYPQTCIVVSRKLLKAQPQAVKEFLKDLQRSIGWLHQNPGAGGSLAEKYVQISAAAVQKGLPRCNLNYQPVRRVRPEVRQFLQRLSETAPEAIGGKLPDEGFYYQP
jgi:NitT/TauT family transport system substrate-binding protein